MKKAVAKTVQSELAGAEVGEGSVVFGVRR